MGERASVLPNSLPPIGLSREQAAELVGLSPSAFDEMVAAGRYPKPQRFGRRVVWHRVQLETAIDEAFGLRRTSRLTAEQRAMAIIDGRD